MTESVQAFDGHIIVEPDTRHTERVEGGIIYNAGDVRGGDSETGTVVSCGRRTDGLLNVDGQPREPDCPFQPGDRVLFSRFSGSNIRVGDRKLVAMQLSDILAVYVKSHQDQETCKYVEGVDWKWANSEISPTHLSE